MLGVTSSVGAAQVHSTSMAGGIMRMRKLERLPIPSGATVKLEPGGTHIMLAGLRERLVVGRQIELGLRFENSDKQKVGAHVRGSSGDDM